MNEYVKLSREILVAAHACDEGLAEFEAWMVEHDLDPQIDSVDVPYGTPAMLPFLIKAGMWWGWIMENIVNLSSDEDNAVIDMADEENKQLEAVYNLRRLKVYNAIFRSGGWDFWSLDSCQLFWCKFVDVQGVYSEVDITQTFFRQCTFTDVEFDEGEISNCRFEDCKFEKTGFDKVDLMSTEFDTCTFSDDTLYPMTDEELFFKNCTFTHMVLKDIPFSSFQSCTFKACTFVGDMTGTFTNCEFDHCDFAECESNICHYGITRVTGCELP